MFYYIYLIFLHIYFKMEGPVVHITNAAEFKQKVINADKKKLVSI